MQLSSAALPATVAALEIPTDETDTTGVHPTRELRRAFRRAGSKCWNSRISRSRLHSSAATWFRARRFASGWGRSNLDATPAPRLESAWTGVRILVWI